jgi:hypothetical protein
MMIIVDVPWCSFLLHSPGWWFGTWFLFFPFSWECHVIPTDSNFSEGLKPPTSFFASLLRWCPSNFGKFMLDADRCHGFQLLQQEVV